MPDNGSGQGFQLLLNDLQASSASRFLASMLHEVRTPIQTVISTAELLQDTKLDDEQTEYVHQIEFSANALLELANDVLDFTKIGSDNFKFENIPFDVVELTERTVDLISIEAFNKGLEIITDTDPKIPKMIMGDPTRVQQVILNLVKNAVKFTSKGFVVVRISYHESYLLFEIIDSGIGVDVQKQKLIFNEFYQVDASTTRKFGGSGLGLAISKKLIEAMHGKIGIYSDGKMGSNFWFSLPMKKAEFGETSGEFTFTDEERVLVVDNSKLMRSSLLRKLASLGVRQITLASSGKEALSILQNAALKKKPFCLVLIDLFMPGIDGWHLAFEIKNNDLLRNLSLYLMVPEGQIGKEARMKLLNWFSGYIYKPVKHSELSSLLHKAFNKEKSVSETGNSVRQAAQSGSENIAKGKLILVAEDHPVNCRIICTFLERFGAKVLVAKNGEEAVEQIRNNPQTDLVFMDILMPVKSGIDATVEIRRMNFTGIIIACTANNEPEDFKTYKELGINDILLKPFKREDIKHVLEKWKTILSYPEAKEIITLTEVSNNASDCWNINDLLDTVDSNVELAESLMDDYIDQTQSILDKLKEECETGKNIDAIELYTHTLKGSSAAVSAFKLAQTGKLLNDAAKTADIVKVKALYTDFALDFQHLKTVVKNWKATL